MHPLAVEQEFMARSARTRAWGTGLLVVAGLLWAYAAWQVFVPSSGCSAPAFADRRDVYVDDHNDSYLAEEAREHAATCAADRDWPAPMTGLVLSTPLGVAGGVMFAAGGTAVRIRTHEQMRTHAEGAAASKG